MINNKQNKIKKRFGIKNSLTANSFKLKASSGFTLIETLVAITVLLLSITGPLEIASKSLFSAFYARDQITAYYLAQEGIEYIKNARDTTFLHDVFSTPATDNNYWLSGLDVCIDSGNGTWSGCYLSATDVFDPLLIDPSDPLDPNNPVKACSGANSGVCPVMSFDETIGLWTQTETPTNPTKFTRKIEIIPQGNVTPLSGSNGREEAIIKVTVEWPTASFLGGTKTFELFGAMMNWERK